MEDGKFLYVWQYEMTGQIAAFDWKQSIPPAGWVFLMTLKWDGHKQQANRVYDNESSAPEKV